MIYAVTLSDGRLVKLTVLPNAATVGEIRFNKIAFDNGVVTMHCANAAPVAFKIDHAFESLRADSIDGMTLEFPSPESILEKAATTNPELAKPASVREVREADFPARHPLFRDAMVDDGKIIGYDMDKARALWRDNLRTARSPLFAPLDAAYAIADESGDTAKKAVVAATRKALREVTVDPRIDGAKSVDDLEKCWPAVLGERVYVGVKKRRLTG